MSYYKFKTSSPKKSHGPTTVNNGWNGDPSFDLIAYSRALKNKCEFLTTCLEEVRTKTSSLSKSDLSTLIFRLLQQSKEYDEPFL